jgi:hypothetical protein
MIRLGFINSLAAVTKDAIPIRGKPSQIAFKDFIIILGIGELHPFTSKSIGEFSHEALMVCPCV